MTRFTDRATEFVNRRNARGPEKAGMLLGFMAGANGAVEEGLAILAAERKAIEKASESVPDSRFYAGVLFALDAIEERLRKL